MEGCLPGCREGIRQGIPCGQASTLILEWLWSFPSSPLWWGTSANAGPYARTHLPRTTQGRGPSPAGDRGGQHDQRPTTGSSPKYQNPTVSQFLGLTKDEEEKPQQVWTSSACPPTHKLYSYHMIHCVSWLIFPLVGFSWFEVSHANLCIMCKQARLWNISNLQRGIWMQFTHHLG